MGWVGVGAGTQISRDDLADFILTQVEDRRFVLALAGSAQHGMAEFEARAVQDAGPHFASLTTSDLDLLAALLRSVTDRS